MQPPNHLPFSPKALSLSIFFSFQPLPSVMDAAAHWPQGIGVECSRNVEKKPRPAQEQALNCPRCKSTNTKFCYYNNYSLSQPRYFCKSCRRYWTEGGTLRNVPVGGSSRKNKRSSNTNSTKKLMIPEPDLISPPRLISPQQNPKMSYNDPVTAPYNGISELVALPFALEAENLNPQNPNSSSSSSMRGIFSSSGGQLITSPLISLPAVSYDPNSAFKLDGVQNRFGNMVQGDDPSNSSRMIFPFEDQSRPLVNDHSNGYWSGMLSGGSW